MKRLVDKAYARKAVTAKGRREQERNALKDHIYLPAVHKTLRLFKSPRVGTQCNDDVEATRGRVQTAAATTEAVRPKARTSIGVELLSSQVKSLQEELHRLAPSSAATTGVRRELGNPSPGATFWCPQPPRTAANGSYRSARFSSTRLNSTDLADVSLATTSSESECLPSQPLSPAISRSDGVELSLPSEHGGLSDRSSLESHVLRLLERVDKSVGSLSSTSDGFRSNCNILSDDDDDDLVLLQGFEEVMFVNDHNNAEERCVDEEEDTATEATPHCRDDASAGSNKIIAKEIDDKLGSDASAYGAAVDDDNNASQRCPSPRFR